MPDAKISRRTLAGLASKGTLGTFILANTDAADHLQAPPHRDQENYVLDLQNLIDDAFHRGGGIVTLPAGRIITRPFRLRDSVVVEGKGATATELNVMTVRNDPAVTLDTGPVRYAGLRKLGIRPHGNKTANTAIDLVAQKPNFSGIRHGGLWWSSFEELYIKGFSKGIVFTGGQDDLLPHQFLTLRRIQVTVPSDGIAAIFFSGMVNQVKVSESLLETSAESDNVGLVTFDGIQDTHFAPTLIKFDMVTMQGAKTAVKISGAQSIGFDSCWFELLGQAALIDKRAKDIIFSFSRFANAGKNGAVVFCDHDASATVRDSVFSGESSFGPDAGNNTVLEKNIFQWGAEK